MEILYLAVFFVIMFFIALGVYFFVYLKIDSFSSEPMKISVERLEMLSADEARKNFNRKFLEITGSVSSIKYTGSEYIMTLGKNFKCYFKYANFPIVLLENEMIKVSGFYFDNGNLRGLKKCSV